MDWQNIWDWISKKENRELVTWIVSGIAAIVVAAWALYKWRNQNRLPNIPTGRDEHNHTRLSDPLDRPIPSNFGIVPPMPSLVLGREDDADELKARLGIARLGQQAQPMQRVTVIRGLPGVGKTTLVATLAHDDQVNTAFPDGVLWISLGPEARLESALLTWGRALSISEIEQETTAEDLARRLSNALQKKRMLLLVDDVWDSAHGQRFKIGGEYCAILFTTRETKIAEDLAPRPQKDIYYLDKLSDDQALALLKELAPQVITDHPKECLLLVKELEGLPLSLQVAGRLLNAEYARGFSVTDLLAELKEGVKILRAEPPPNRPGISYAEKAMLTVTVLLEKTTERLKPETRELFARLGPFAPKPATFELDDLRFCWEVENPKDTVRELIDRGLLEPVEIEGLPLYQMHALLVAHANDLLDTLGAVARG